MKNRTLWFATVFFVVWIILIKIVDMGYVEVYASFSEEEEYHIKAVVVSDKNEKEYKRVYEIEIREINGNKKYKGDKWLLNIKKSKQYDITDLKYGDLLEFNGKIEIPSAARNYKGFDYQKYLKTKKIYGTITASEKVNILSENRCSLIGRIIHNIRIDMRKRIYKLLPEDARELCIGILIGERTDIDEDITEAFKDSNLTHMLAVSGSHISYIVVGLSVLLRKVGNRFYKVVTILFLVFFMGLTGFTASVERASIMAIFMLLASLVHRKSEIYTNLLLSSFIILICNPYTIFDMGFQLSYGGTIGIILITPKLTKWLYSKVGLKEFESLGVKISEYKGVEKIRIYLKKLFKYIVDMFIVTISANVIIIPIMMIGFNTISFNFWISNILAGPLLAVITIAGFIMYFISIISINLANIVAFPLKYAIELLIFIAEFCSKLPFSSVIVKTPHIVHILIYYYVIFVIYNWKSFKENFKKYYFILVQECKKRLRDKNFKRALFTIALAIIIVFSSSIFIINNNRDLKIYFVDVGQGDCTLIRTPNNKTILIDGGGSENSSFDVGEQTLFPYLLDRQITKIDYMIISHMDSDHVGGLFYILENMKVKHTIICRQGEISENYRRFKEIVSRKNIHVTIVKQGDRLRIDNNVYFDILFPTDNLIKENVLNNNSIVAKLCYNNFSCLFTGDIEEIAEKELVNKYQGSNVLNSTILKIAHHGSKSSSIQEILNLIKPKVALIGVGDKNTFGHPNEGVLDRLINLRCEDL